MRVLSFIFTILLSLIFVLSLVTDWYSELVFALNIVLLLALLDKLGKGIVLREIIALHSAMICLLMPLLGYLIYNQGNAIARMWVRYMPIQETVYFGFALPAVTLFAVALTWPIQQDRGTDQGKSLLKLVDKIKLQLQAYPRTGLYLMIAGVFISFFINALPVALQFIFNLLYYASFAGCLYVYFARSFRYKKLILVLFLLLILMTALQSGMFTIIAYMGMTIFSFLFLGRKLALWKKLIFFIAATFLLMVIQGVKPIYRNAVWLNSYEGNKAALFADLMLEKIASSGGFASPEVFFPIYYRGNQGFNVALVMRRIPAAQPFDNGAELATVMASAFIPRLFWPNKPEAGGAFNMKYYAGINIKGWSTNVGPLGEAYGGFGVNGGILYMGLLGWFIRWAYKRFLVVSRNIPLLFFWLPVLFYQVTYSAETDTQQIINSLLKAAFFVWVLYKLVPGWFGKSKNDTTNQYQRLPNASPAN